MSLYLYDDAHCKHDSLNIFSNPNILRNGDFKIWHRGEAFTDKTKLINRYSASRWRVNHTGLSAGFVIVKNYLYGGMSINKENSIGDVEICQFVEYADMYLNKDLTLSFDGISGSVSYANETTFRLTSSYPNHVITNDNYYFGATYIPADNVIVVKFGIKKLSAIVLKYIKLEFGNKATQYIYTSKVEESLLCQRYGYYLKPTYYLGIMLGTYYDGHICGTIQIEKMRINPTVKITGQLTYYSIANKSNVIDTPIGATIDANTGYMEITPGKDVGMVNGETCLVQLHPNSILDADAEIY